MLALVGCRNDRVLGIPVLGSDRVLAVIALPVQLCDAACVGEIAAVRSPSVGKWPETVASGSVPAVVTPALIRAHSTVQHIRIRPVNTWTWPVVPVNENVHTYPGAVALLSAI